MQFLAEFPENSGVNIFDDKIDRVCLGITKWLHCRIAYLLTCPIACPYIM